MWLFCLTPWWNVLAHSELCIHFPFLNPSSPYLTFVTTLKQLTALLFFPCSFSLFFGCSSGFSLKEVLLIVLLIIPLRLWWPIVALIFHLVFLGSPICPGDFICCCSRAVFCPVSFVLPICLATPWVKYGQNYIHCHIDTQNSSSSVTIYPIFFCHCWEHSPVTKAETHGSSPGILFCSFRLKSTSETLPLSACSMSCPV